MSKVWMIPLLLGCLSPLSALSEATEAPFRLMPVRTPEQQSAMNSYGHLALAETLYNRCGKAMQPVPTDSQRQAVLKYYQRSETAAARALHEAYPLDHLDDLKAYLALYRDKENEAANGAIDHSGCDDPRVQIEMELLGTLHRQLAP